VTSIRLIAGLGNPGEEYAATRHNAGFLVLDLLAEKLGAHYWKDECGSEVAHVRRGDDELLLAKPQSFMNASGGPVSKLAQNHHLTPEQILIIHDDMDLPSGTVRVKVGGGHAGHNGLKSLHAKLGSADYVRVRVGTGHPSGRKTVIDHVLSVPRGEDAELFEQAIARAADAVLCVVEDGPVRAMNRFN
jgi:peptidyl-tRNA hydrolase, PTH1 family